MAVVQQFGNKQEEVDKESGVTDFSKSTGGGVTSPGTVQQTKAPTRQGSGRFVNLQKYISANEGAGQRMGAGIGQKVQSGFESQQKKSDEELSGLRSAFQGGQQALSRGQGTLSSLKGEGFDVASFGKDTKNLEDVAKFQQGMNVDEQDLFKKQSAYQQAQQKALSDVNKRLGQVGSEEGRFGLLKETYGGGIAAPRRYTTGQQRLDQLFLQSGESDQVKNLENLVSQRQRAVNLGQQEAEKFGTDIKKLAEDEAKLASDLSKQTASMFESGRTAAEQKLLQTQQARDTEARNFETNYAAMMDNDPNTVPEPGFLEKLGVRAGERTYGALNRNTTLDELANIDRSQLSLGQALSEDEINRLNILSRLSQGRIGEDNTYQYDASGDLAKQQASDVIGLKRNLRADIDAGRAAFEKAVAEASPIVGVGRWGDAAATESMNIRDYLKGINTPTFWNNSGNYGGGSPVPILSDIVNAIDVRLSGRKGVPEEDYTAAEVVANQNRIKQLQDFLSKYGYSDVLSTGGFETGQYDPDKLNLRSTPRVRG